MPNKSKIDVLTVRLTVHIPVDPGEPDTVIKAGLAAKDLHATMIKLGQATKEAHVTRVSAPEPAQEASEPEPAAAE